MLKELLDNACEDGLQIPKDLLNDGLHTALRLNRPEAAAMLLAAGADTSLYNFLESGVGSDNVVPDAFSFCSTMDPARAWTELVRAAEDDVDAPYLAELIKEASRSPGTEDKAGRRDSGDRGAAWRVCGTVLDKTKLGAVDELSMDAELFMLLLLANRPGLAKLMWLRDAQERGDHALRSALVACVLCRRLAQLPGVKDRSHALDTLRQVRYLRKRENR
jgi:hypothetical protein